MTEKQAIDTLQLNRPFAYSELRSAVDMAIQALEKQIPKKMERYQCPECRHYFEDGEPHKYCPCCGQRLE